MPRFHSVALTAHRQHPAILRPGLEYCFSLNQLISFDLLSDLQTSWLLDLFFLHGLLFGLHQMILPAVSVSV
jgi:hypothetical protein